MQFKHTKRHSIYANFFPLLILTRALCKIDEMTEAQRGTGTCPKSHSWELEEAM